MNKTKCYRHGELCFKETDKLPKGLKISKTNVLEIGSHGNSHTFKGGKLYLLPELKEFTLGYFVAKDTTLFHPEHGDKNGEAKLQDGVYQILKQSEYTPNGLVPVID